MSDKQAEFLMYAFIVFAFCLPSIVRAFKVRP